MASNKELERLRLDNVVCHYKRDILDSLFDAMAILPACGSLAIMGAATQEITAMRDAIRMVLDANGDLEAISFQQLRNCLPEETKTNHAKPQGE